MMKKSLWLMVLAMVFIILQCSVEKPPSQPAQENKLVLSLKPDFQNSPPCPFLNQISASFPKFLKKISSQKPEGRFEVNRQKIDFSRADYFQCDEKTCQAVVKDLDLKAGTNLISVRVFYPDHSSLEKQIKLSVPEYIKTTLKEIGSNPEKFFDKFVCLKGLALGWAQVHLTEQEKKFAQKPQAKGNWGKSRSDGSFCDTSACSLNPGFSVGKQWQEMCAQIIKIENQPGQEILWRLEPICSREIAPFVK